MTMTAQEYRANARQCLSWAESARDPENREAFFALAATWEAARRLGIAGARGPLGRTYHGMTSTPWLAAVWSKLLSAVRSYECHLGSPVRENCTPGSAWRHRLNRKRTPSRAAIRLRAPRARRNQRATPAQSISHW
jgi:hypothetical protein